MINHSAYLCIYTFEQLSNKVTINLALHIQDVLLSKMILIDNIYGYKKYSKISHGYKNSLTIFKTFNFETFITYGKWSYLVKI